MRRATKEAVGVRTWKERMMLLETLGFIKSRKAGNQQYKFVLLVHPTIAVKRLHEKGLVDDVWFSTYRERQIDSKEPDHDDLIASHKQPEEIVIPAPPAVFAAK